MITYELNDRRSEFNKHIGFLTAIDAERDIQLRCKVYIFENMEVMLEKFIKGNVGKHNFQCSDWDYDTLNFKGVGRGRKPKDAEKAMRDFIKEVYNDIRYKEFK